MTRLTRRGLALSAATSLSVMLLGREAFAQTYPSQDIHFIVGFAPGSGPDLIARWIAEKIRPHLNDRTILIENKVGAGGNIATEYVARAKPDGYVIYITGGSALAASGHLFRESSGRRDEGIPKYRDLGPPTDASRRRTKLIIQNDSRASGRNEEQG